MRERDLDFPTEPPREAGEAPAPEPVRFVALNLGQNYLHETLYKCFLPERDGSGEDTELFFGTEEEVREAPFFIGYLVEHRSRALPAGCPCTSPGSRGIGVAVRQKMVR